MDSVTSVNGFGYRAGANAGSVALGRRERSVVRSAAVIGERFWTGPLASLPGIGDVDLDQALGRLQELELIAPSPRSALRGDKQYAFKHELVQRVAYRRLPKAERARLRR